MRKKLRNILLIDDYKADNFLHQRVIKLADVAQNIMLTSGAREALDYLSERVAEEYPKPEIVFLDINMPGMSGWDFLEEYQQLEEEIKAGVIVCMLTTSYAERDKKKAAQYNVLSDFSTKPLTKEKLMGIIERHFSDYI